MNLMLLEDADLVGEGRARVGGRHCTHVRKVLRLGEGDTLRVGRVNGPTGEARICALQRDELELEISWNAQLTNPQPSPLTLAFAIPRPPTLSKVMQQATALGVKRFWIFGARRVEKSYWGARGATEASIREDMKLGLEQARDTALPSVQRFERFRPFVEDHLVRAATQEPVWVADPLANKHCPAASSAARVLVLGPEGGFVDFERELFERCGLPAFSMGPRILRVETAAVALLARLGA